MPSSAEYGSSSSSICPPMLPAGGGSIFSVQYVWHIYTHVLHTYVAYALYVRFWIKIVRSRYDFAWCSSKAGAPAVPGSGLPNPTLQVGQPVVTEANWSTIKSLTMADWTVQSTFSTLSDLYTELAPLVQSGSVAGASHSVSVYVSVADALTLTLTLTVPVQGGSTLVATKWSEIAGRTIRRCR